MTVFNFKDMAQNMTITFMAENEEKAWEVLCDNFGTGYVFENMEYLGNEID